MQAHLQYHLGQVNTNHTCNTDTLIAPDLTAPGMAFRCIASHASIAGAMTSCGNALSCASVAGAMTSCGDALVQMLSAGVGQHTHTPAEQPIPARLWESMSERILKWLTSMEAREGVGAKQEQTTMRTSICAPMRFRYLCPKSGAAKSALKVHDKWQSELQATLGADSV